MAQEQLLINSIDEKQTRQLGLEVGRRLAAGFTISLDGNLGAGKTRLTQAIAVGLDIPDGQVKSPTFTLSVPHSGRLQLLHVDAYRLKQLSEVDELGLDEWVDSGGVLIVEWANKISTALPPLDLAISIETNSESRRSFHLVAHSAVGVTIVNHVRTWQASNGR